jgi:MYXO-CTERM domain-containing protein
MRMRRLGLAVVLALGMALVPTAAHAGPTDDIHSLVNQARWSNGQAGLLRNAAMDQVAANWAAQLAANGTLSHNPNYSSEIPGGWTAAAENVAQGYGSGAAMHEGWMNSPGHRANVLGGFTDIGIAFLSSGGTTWGVQVFANYPGHVGPAAPAPPAPPAPAEPAPAPAPAPAKPAPTEEVAASPTPEPSSRATATATRAPTPEPRTPAASGESGDDGTSGPPWWPVVAGLALIALAAVWTARRQRLER